MLQPLRGGGQQPARKNNAVSRHYRLLHPSAVCDGFDGDKELSFEQGPSSISQLRIKRTELSTRTQRARYD